MAQSTWNDGAALYSPVLPPEGEPIFEEGGLRAITKPARTYTTQQNLLIVNTAQETLLLLLLGVSSNMVAFGIDKSIDFFVSARAHAAQEAGTFLLSYLMWTGSALVLCGLSAACVHYISPSAAGSGIPQMKCVLAGGANIEAYLSRRTLVAKILSVVLAMGGGLSIGKEGPYVHISSCVAQQLTRLSIFRRLGQSETLRRQMLAAGCAAGVASTFGAPVGGVLFSIEVTATYYSVSHLWKAMFTAVCGAWVFRVSRDMGSLALFNLTNFSDMGELLYNGEIYAFALLGVLMGMLGAAFVHATASLVQLVRQLRNSLEVVEPPGKAQRWPCSACTLQRLLAALLSRYGYTLVVAFTSAMLTFPFGFFRSSPQEVINELFGSAPFDFTARWSNPSLIVNLLIYTVCKFVFTCIAVGAPISCGVYTPVFLIGAASGRCFGEVLNLLTPSDHQITAGGYAVVGAASMAAGVTRTISTAVIVFELTGQLNHMLPVLVAVLAACGVGNLMNDSIYDTMMRLNNLPFLRPLHESQSRRLCAQDVMDPCVVALSRQCTYMDVYVLLKHCEAPEFPLVDSNINLLLIGSLRRSVLQNILNQHLLNPKHTRQARVLDVWRESVKRRFSLKADELQERAVSLRSRLDALRSPVAFEAGTLTLLQRIRHTSPCDVRVFASSSPPTSVVSGALAQDDVTGVMDANSEPMHCESHGHHTDVGSDGASRFRGGGSKDGDVRERAVPDARTLPTAPSRVDSGSSQGSQQWGRSSWLQVVAAEGGSRAEAFPMPTEASLDAASPVQPEHRPSVFTAAPAADKSASVASGKGQAVCDYVSTVHRPSSRPLRPWLAQAHGLPEPEVALLSMPLQLGVDASPPAAHARASCEVDLVPSVVLATTPLHEVHMQFSLLSIDHAYVTFAGKLLGVIRRSDLLLVQSRENEPCRSPRGTVGYGTARQ